MTVKEKEKQELEKVDWGRISTNLEKLLLAKKDQKIGDLVQEEVEKIISNYKGRKEALIEILHQTQELIGFIPRAVQRVIARGLEISPTEVSSVISFYAHFSDNPKGKYQIALCKGTACYVKSSAEIIDKIYKEYNIKSGETTRDGMFSLEVVRCLGACGLAPVMTVNGKAHGQLNPEKAIMILEEYKRKEIKGV
ncbi:MAG: NAD(P)H-dependent oxidoreductase subunit E [Halanaerobiaceae bacterium]